MSARSGWILGLWLLTGLASAAPVQQSEPALIPQRRAETWLSGVDIKSYPVKASAGQRLTVNIDRYPAELIVELLDPKDQRLIVYPTEGSQGEPLKVTLVADQSGVYRLRLRTRYVSEPASALVLTLQAPAAASPLDRGRFEALSLSTRAELANEAGRYDEAVELSQRSLDVAKRAGSGEDEMLASLYFRVGTSQSNKARRQEAASAYEEALRIDKAVLGEDHPAGILVLLGMTRLYNNYGDFPQGEETLRRARAAIEKAWGPQHPWIAECLMLTAEQHLYRGDPPRALADLEAALAIIRAHPTADQRQLILALNSAADVYVDLPDYDRARALLEETLRLEEHALNPDNPWAAHTLQNLGIVARHADDYDKALNYYWRAEKIRANSVGPEHPSTLSLLVNIGNVYHAQGDDAHAVEVFERALAGLSLAVGPIHEFTVMTLGNLAKSFAARGEIRQAVETLTRANEAIETSLSLHLAIGSEHERLMYANKFSAVTERTVSLNLNQAPDDALATELAAQTLLQRKGRVLDALAQSLASLRTRLLPEDRALLDELSAATTEFARTALRGPGESTPAQYRERLDALEKRQEDLEEKVSQRTAGFYQSSQSVTLASVRAALPADAVLLEFMVYHPFDVHKVDTEEVPAHYALYVIPPSGPIRVKDLGPIRDIDLQVEAFRRALRDPNANPSSASSALYAKVLQPVSEATAGSHRLILSPDGALNLIPFEALTDAKGRYLLSSKDVSYVSSGRDLLRLAASPSVSSAPVILAAPDFGEPVGGSGELVVAQRRGADARRGVTIAADLSEVYFTSLAGTAREARELKGLFPDAVLFTGDRASKGNLKAVDAPKILHIATHGFFLDHEARPHAEDSVKTRGVRAASSLENPLLRSGLALAGANESSDENSGGILTALEAANLNLWGTKLVTLSACDTGVGEIRNGEGVYGLRRAFVLAGAQTLIMSLWPVSDSVTRQLMSDYYRGLKQGLGRGVALHQAQQAMMARANRAHPFYWASFIQVGEWANLYGVR
jgi:CHAT domain-containing protein